MNSKEVVESAINMRSLKLINKIKKSGVVKSGSMSDKGDEKIKEDAMTAADAGIPHDTKDAGPRSRLPVSILRRSTNPINATDRRRKKDKPPRLLKKFRDYNG